MAEKFPGWYRCTRCYGLANTSPGMVCEDCMRPLRRTEIPRHHPRDERDDPAQENAIRAWEDGG